MKRKRLTQEDKERLFAGRVPGQAVTYEEWLALGYGPDGKQTRPFTDEPMGWKPRPRPETPTT